MTLLLSLLAALYAADVRLLGSPSWAERQAATERLAAALPWSYPAVCRGEGSAVPEVAMRCHRVKTRCVAVVERRIASAELLWLFFDPRKATDGWLDLADAEWAIRHDLMPLAERIAFDRGWIGEDLTQWPRNGPWYEKPTREMEALGWLNVVRHRAWGTPLAIDDNWKPRGK